MITIIYACPIWFEWSLFEIINETLPLATLRACDSAWQMHVNKDFMTIFTVYCTQ